MLSIYCTKLLSGINITSLKCRSIIILKLRTDPYYRKTLPLKINREVKGIATFGMDMVAFNFNVQRFL